MSSVPIFKPLYLVIYTTLTLAFSVLLTECLELLLCKIPGWSMHVFLSKLTRFESTDFASVMIDDVGSSRRHQCPQCALKQCRLPLGMACRIYDLTHWGRDKIVAFFQTFLNAFSWTKISIKITPKLVSRGPINNIPALVQIMAWCHPVNKGLSEQMNCWAHFY